MQVWSPIIRKAPLLASTCLRGVRSRMRLNQMRLSGNIKFNLDFGQLLAITTCVLSIIGSLITIAILL